MKVQFIYEHFFPPFDEGVKNFAFMVNKKLNLSHQVQLVRDIRSVPSMFNNLFIVPRIVLKAIFFRPDKVIYIPKSAFTFSSLLKIAILKTFLGKKLIAVGVQKRNFSKWQTHIARLLPMPKLYVLSAGMADELKKIGHSPQVIPIGVDSDRYRPSNDRKLLYKKYSISEHRQVLLHVGHIKESRNVRWLMDVQLARPDIQVVLVGSTTTEQDDALLHELESAGIMVIRQHLPDIHELYQIASWYCFPVQQDNGAMEVPLSILEGMATNLPIITTRFGRVPEQFEEDEYFRYIENSDDILTALQALKGTSCNNREKAAPYTWSATAEILLTNELK